MITAKGEITLTLKDSSGNGSITTTGTVAKATEGATLIIESGKYVSTGSNAL